MVKITVVLVCILIIAADIAAGICGIEAEIAQNRAKHLKLWIFECKHPSQEAYKLGAAAAFLLVVAHVIASSFGGCACKQDQYEKGPANRQLSKACLIFSWLILAVGLGMLVIGTLANKKSRVSCGFTDHHMLSIGGILCFIHGLFSVAYYASATSCN